MDNIGKLVKPEQLFTGHGNEIIKRYCESNKNGEGKVIDT